VAQATAAPNPKGDWTQQYTLSHPQQYQKLQFNKIALLSSRKCT